MEYLQGAIINAVPSLGLDDRRSSHCLACRYSPFPQTLNRCGANWRLNISKTPDERME